MTAPDAVSTPRPRALTLRAVLIGLALSAGLAVLTPLNDYRLDNTFMFSQHLPVAVMLLVVLAGLAVNPLLGRRRLAPGELMVVAGMLLVLGGVVSSGLNRLLTGVMAGPARLVAVGTELEPLKRPDGSLPLPPGAFVMVPERGPVPVGEPDYRYVVEGFMTGLGSGEPAVRHRATVTWRDAAGVHRAQALGAGAGAADLDLASPLGVALAGRRAGDHVTGPDGPLDILSVRAPPVPWAVWGAAFLRWVPLLGGAMVAFLAIAALVRRQWMEHERLPYPIAGAIAAYLEAPAPGSRFAPVFRSRAFWCGFALATAVLVLMGTNVVGWQPFEVDTRLRLESHFAGRPWDQVWQKWMLYNLRVYFSIIAITFLLPLDLAFSLWFFYVLVQVAYAVLRINGVPVAQHHPSAAGIGGYAVQACLILWIGRVHYLRVLRTAFGLGGGEDRALAVYAWALIAGLVGMVATMAAHGAQVHHALLATAVYCGIGLVLARLVAEAGIPFLNQPTWWGPTSVIYSLTGLSVPVAALVPLTLLAQTLMNDSREALLPYAANAEALAARAGAPRLPWTAALLLVLAIGTVVAGGTMLWLAYHGDGAVTLDGDNNWRGNAVLAALGPPAAVASGGTWSEADGVWTAYGAGAVLTAGLGIARLAWSWWPLHPAGFLVAATFATGMAWFSFFLGWLAKAVTLRYGGLLLYRRMVPFALGLIAGEAIAAGLFLVLGLLDGVFGWGLPKMPRFLPS